MRTYQCHKRVKAAQIVDVTPNLHGFVLTLEGGKTATASNEMTARYRPVVGDYMVVYEGDGYRSISPRKAFEDGYRELPSEDELAQAVTFTVQPHVGAAAEVKPTIENGAIIGVQVVKDDCTYQELTSEPLTDELSCLMFGTKAGMAISDRMKASV